MIGIYKIQSPSGRVYIGQSVNIEQRWGWYRSLKSVKRQKKLYRSFLKYGVKEHVFSVLHELPSDATSEVLTNYENFYIDLHGDSGFPLLNITAGRKSRYGIRLTESQREHLRKINLGKKPSPETLAKLKGRKVWNKGKKMPAGFVKGRPHTEETKERIRQIRLGTKLSPESIAKRTATLKKNGVKRKWSDEAKKRQSERYLGKKKSEETLLKGRLTRMLKKEALNAVQ